MKHYFTLKILIVCQLVLLLVNFAQAQNDDTFLMSNCPICKNNLGKIFIEENCSNSKCNDGYEIQSVRHSKCNGSGYYPCETCRGGEYRIIQCDVANRQGQRFIFSKDCSYEYRPYATYSDGWADYYVRFCNKSLYCYRCGCNEVECNDCEGGQKPCTCNGGYTETRIKCSYKCKNGKVKTPKNCEHPIAPIIDWDKPTKDVITSISKTYTLEACIYSTAEIINTTIIHNQKEGDIYERGGVVEASCTKYISYKGKLEKGDNYFKIIATNKYGKTTSKVINIKYEGGVELSENTSTGKYYALIVGVSSYKPPLLTLPNPVNDARKISNILTTYYTFDAFNVDTLMNPTKETFLKKLEFLKESLNIDDHLFISFSGHGKEGFWMFSDAISNNKFSWLTHYELLGKISEIKSKHILVVADACFSGSLLTPLRNSELDCKILEKSNSRTGFTSGALEIVPDNSIFLKKLLEYLKNNQESCISASSIFADISEYVRLNSSSNQKPQYGMLPTAGDHNGGDFIFVKR